MTRLIVFFLSIVAYAACSTCRVSPDNPSSYFCLYKELYNAGKFEELVQKLFHPDAILLTNEKIYRGHAEIVEAIKIEEIYLQRMLPIHRGDSFGHVLLTYSKPHSTYRYYFMYTMHHYKYTNVYVFPPGQ